MSERKLVICANCDIQSQVSVIVPESGEMGDVKAKPVDPHPLHAEICMKGIHAPSGFDHPKRITKPLRRVGERGDGLWEEISWD